MAGVGVTFGSAHTYRTWGLKLKEVTIGFPEVKTSYVDIPGRNGQLDLTEAMFGGVTYGNRELRFVLDARNCSYADWSTLISEIATAIHGKQLQITLDTDPDYYYTGRCSIDTEKTNDVLAVVGITCNCMPYKTSKSGTGGVL